MNYAEVVVKPKLRRSEKIKPLVSAILAEAEEQGVTLDEFVTACDLAVEMVRNEMDVSSVGIAVFASKAKATLDSL